MRVPKPNMNVIQIYKLFIITHNSSLSHLYYFDITAYPGLEINSTRPVRKLIMKIC